MLKKLPFLQLLRRVNQAQSLFYFEKAMWYTMRHRKFRITAASEVMP